MKKNALYPLTFDFISNRPELLKDIFQKARPHKGAYIGVCVLDGSFLCDSQETLFASLDIGEELLLVPDANAKPNTVLPIEVKRQDGTVIGNVPYQHSLLPLALVSRGISIFAFLEAKDFKSGLLSVAVSLYCERY